MKDYKQTYSEKLKHPFWQKKRLEIFNRDSFACQMCGSTTKTLHVHHKYYDKKYQNPWEYPDDSLITYCEDCHENIDKIKEASEDLGRAIISKGFNCDCIRFFAQAFRDCVIVESHNKSLMGILYTISMPKALQQAINDSQKLLDEYRASENREGEV